MTGDPTVSNDAPEQGGNKTAGCWKAQLRYGKSRHVEDQVVGAVGDHSNPDGQKYAVPLTQYSQSRTPRCKQC